jgi:uncharacterized membrane protein YGL010W
MALISSRSWQDWLTQYAASHQHPVNRVCHTIGIPLVVSSLLLLPLFWLAPQLWALPVGLFVVGWIFQFVGHAFEGKPPEFMTDWRFLFVGVRWWLAKVQGKA